MVESEAAERLREWFDAQRGIEGVRLDRAISTLLGELDERTRRWARSLCAAHADRTGSHVDDVHNLIRLEIALKIRSHLGAVDPAPIDDFHALFRRIASRAAYSYFHSSAYTGVRGANGAARRASTIHSTRAELAAELGRDPSDAEVIAEVNRRAHLSRRDPAKQGALATSADLAPTAFVPLELLADLASTIGATESDTSLDRLDAERLVARTLDVSRAVSPALGDAARLWIGQALADPPVVRTAAEIAEELGATPQEAERLLHGCRTIATLIGESEFGVSSPFG